MSRLGLFHVRHRTIGREHAALARVNIREPASAKLGHRIADADLADRID